MVTRIDRLTAEQETRMHEWAAKWIATGLTTGPTDKPRAEVAIRRCCVASGLREDMPVIWVPSPVVGALAFPIACAVVAAIRGGRDPVDSAVRSAVDSAVHSAVRSAVGSAVDSAVHSAVHSAVRSAVDSAVDSAVHSAVRSAVGSAVGSAVDSAVDSAVHSAVDSAVHSAVHSAVRSAVRSAVDSAVDSAVHSAVHSAVRSAVGSIGDADLRRVILDTWHRYIGGQFWVGWGWGWGGPAFVSFFQDVCGLELSPELTEAARAYQAQAEALCYWWPSRDFVIACERPHTIAMADGRLHSTTGPAVGWDGWGVYRVDGVDVPRYVVEEPHTITVDKIHEEQNAEVRRVMIDRVGRARYLVDAQWELVDHEVIHEASDADPTGHWRKLFRRDRMVLVQFTNSGLDADGTRRIYEKFCHPQLRPLPDPEDPTQRLGEPQKMTAHNAIASTYGLRGEDYRPAVET